MPKTKLTIIVSSNGRPLWSKELEMSEETFGQLPDEQYTKVCRVAENELVRLLRIARKEGAKVPAEK